MFPRMLTPETSPEPEARASGLWQPKSTTTTPPPKRKRSWPYSTTRPASPSTSSPGRGEPSGSTTSVKALWENGWKSAARRASPPFQDAAYDDLEPIFNTLIESGLDDAASPEYTLAFYPKAHDLALRAENALLHHGDRALASALYLRACAVLRTARYSPATTPTTSTSTPTSPTPCPVRARAWQLQKSYHLKAGRLWGASPLDEVTIPHTHDAATRPGGSSSLGTTTTGGVRDRGDSTARAAAAAARRPQIPLAVRLPPRTLHTGAPCPAVLVAAADRTAHTSLCDDLLARGWGCVVVEAPGCGDCPVPSSSSQDGGGGGDAAALWASVLEWMGAIRVFDMARVVVWAAGVDDAAGMVGQFGSAAVRVRGCVAVVEAGSSAAVLAVPAGRVPCRLLVVADGDCDGAAGAGPTLEANGLWTPVMSGGYRGEDDGLVLFEYGALGMGAEAVRLPAANATTVYDWVEDLMSLDMAV